MHMHMHTLSLRMTSRLLAVVVACMLQSSAFGAFLDVLIDITTRALIWTWAVGAAAVPVIILEATTFVCTHAGGGAAWKVGCFADAPAWVAAAVADNFRSIGGVIAIGGIMGLPLWLWACRCGAVTFTQ